MSSVVFISIIFPKSSKLKDYSQVFPCIPHTHPSLTLPLFTPSHTAFVHFFSHCFSSPLSLAAFVASCISLKPLPPSLSQAASPTLLSRTLFCCHPTTISLLRFSSARFSAAISQPSLSYTSLPHLFQLPLSPTTIAYHFRPHYFGSREWISHRKRLSVPLSPDPYEGVYCGLQVESSQGSSFAYLPDNHKVTKFISHFKVLFTILYSKMLCSQLACWICYQPMAEMHYCDAYLCTHGSCSKSFGESTPSMAIPGFPDV